MKKISVFAFLVSLMFQSCEIINPSEEIPSYIRVEKAIVDISEPAVQGTAINDISDCWLYVNGKMIGVFEIPFEVPVLASGDAKIEIQPGIKTSGLDADRDVYQMLTNYTTETNLVAGEVTTIEPHYSYRSGVNFVFVESFDQIGTKYEKSDSSDYGFTLKNEAEGAQEGNSMFFSIPSNDYNGIFECRTTDIYTLPANGVTFMEMSYKCNDYFNFGMFGVVNAATSTTGVRENIMTLYPTSGKWKRIYINLNYAVTNSSATDSEFQPFFTMVRVDTLSPVGQNSEVFIDNIKLLHLQTEAK